MWAKTQVQYKLGACLCALFLGACGSDNAGPESPRLTTISISPTGGNLGIGQAETFSAEGRDQNGAAMGGLSFTWSSSSSTVATVAGGVVTGLTAGTTSITASSGGITSSAVTVTVVVVSRGELVIDKASVLLSGVGEQAQLTAYLIDEHGARSPATATWTSSTPAKVSVDASGQLRAGAIGSAQVFAEASGMRSTPTLVTVAEPVSGAVIVSDQQVVSVGSPLNVPPGGVAGVGTTYEVTLQGVPAPAASAILLAGESAPVAGKVISVRQDGASQVVTVQVVPLYQLFTNYDISFNLDLAAFPVRAVTPASARQTPAASWNAARQAGPRRRMARAMDDLEPFRAFDCQATIKPHLLGTPIQLSVNHSLRLVLNDRPGYSKHALEGSATLTGSAGLQLKAGFSASGDCRAQAQVKVPVFGWFSVFLMPGVRFGFGVQAGGEVTLVQGELAVDGSVGANMSLGWECGGATPSCRGLDGMSLTNDLKTRSRFPSENDKQARISGQFYVVAGLDAVLGSGVANAEILEGRVGPEQSFNLAFEDDQAALTAYASSYDLKLKAVVEPGSALKSAIEEVIDDDATGVSFSAEVSSDLSESPKGTLALSTARVRPGAPVEFTVDLVPSTIPYLLLGDNVTGVQLYRRKEGETEFTSWKAMDRIASNRATYRWEPTEADAGKYEFAAFVNTQLVTPLLEVGPNSIQPLEVSCFSGGSARGASSLRTGPTCSDTWIGTATYTGGAGQTYTTSSQITFTYDAEHSQSGEIWYVGSGSFDLEVFSPSCTVDSWTPRHFTFGPDWRFAQLVIYEGDEPSYGWSATETVSYSVTVSHCNGTDSPPQTLDFPDTPIYLGSGTGSYTPGQATLSGPGSVPGVNWTFSRP